MSSTSYRKLHAMLSDLRGHAKGEALASVEAMMQFADELEVARAQAHGALEQEKEARRKEVSEAYDRGVTDGFGECYRLIEKQRKAAQRYREEHPGASAPEQ